MKQQSRKSSGKEISEQLDDGVIQHQKLQAAASLTARTDTAASQRDKKTRVKKKVGEMPSRLHTNLLVLGNVDNNVRYHLRP